MKKVRVKIGTEKVDFINERLKKVPRYFDLTHKKVKEISYNYNIIINEFNYFRLTMQGEDLSQVFVNHEKASKTMNVLTDSDEYTTIFANHLSILRVYLYKIWETDKVNFENAKLWQDRLSFLRKLFYVYTEFFLYRSHYKIDFKERHSSEAEFMGWLDENVTLPAENRHLRLIARIKDYEELAKILNTFLDNYDNIMTIDEYTSKPEILQMLKNLNFEHMIVQSVDPFEIDDCLTNND